MRSFAEFEAHKEFYNTVPENLANEFFYFLKILFLKFFCETRGVSWFH